MIKKVAYILCGLIFSIGLVLVAAYIGGENYEGDVSDEIYQTSQMKQPVQESQQSLQEDEDAIKHLKLK